MGYELHVTRAPSWTEAEQVPIGRDEVLALVAQDPTLRVDPEFWAGRRTEDGGEVRIEAILFDGGAEHADAFWADQGEILAKYPSEAAVAKLIELARKLGARVQGDSDEVYDLTDDGRKRVNGVVVPGWNDPGWPSLTMQTDTTDLPFDPRAWPVVEAASATPVPAARPLPDPPAPPGTTWSVPAPAANPRPRTSVLVVVALVVVGFWALRAFVFQAAGL